MKTIEYSATDNLEAMATAVNYNNFLLDLVLSHIKAGDCVLDFGAGIGAFAMRISDFGYDVCCVEPDPKQACMISKSGLTVYDDLNQIKDNSLDYVYTLNVLEHIEDDHAILCELYRKLKPGGMVLIFVPAFQVLYSSMDRKVGHYRRYSKSGLSAVVRLSGFTVARTCYVDSFGYLATMLYKLVGNNSGDLNKRALLAYDRIVFPLSRIADRLVGSFIGKNVLLVGKK